MSRKHLIMASREKQSNQDHESSWTISRNQKWIIWVPKKKNNKFNRFKYIELLKNPWLKNKWWSPLELTKTHHYSENWASKRMKKSSFLILHGGVRTKESILWQSLATVHQGNSGRCPDCSARISGNVLRFGAWRQNLNSQVSFTRERTPQTGLWLRYHAG